MKRTLATTATYSNIVLNPEFVGIIFGDACQHDKGISTPLEIS